MKSSTSNTNQSRPPGAAILVNRQDEATMQTYRKGVSVDEIAAMQGRRPAEVRDSLDQVERARALLRRLKEQSP